MERTYKNSVIFSYKLTWASDTSAAAARFSTTCSGQRTPDRSTNSPFNRLQLHTTILTNYRIPEIYNPRNYKAPQA